MKWKKRRKKINFRKPQSESNWTTGQQAAASGRTKECFIQTNIFSRAHTLTHSLHQTIWMCRAQGVRVEWLRRFTFNFAEFSSIEWLAAEREAPIHILLAIVYHKAFAREFGSRVRNKQNGFDFLHFFFVSFFVLFFSLCRFESLCAVRCRQQLCSSKWIAMKATKTAMPIHMYIYILPEWSQTESKWKCQYWLTNDNISIASSDADFQRNVCTHCQICGRRKSLQMPKCLI